MADAEGRGRPTPPGVGRGGRGVHHGGPHASAQAGRGAGARNGRLRSPGDTHGRGGDADQRRLVLGAIEEARATGAPAVEAEHVLLALLRDADARADDPIGELVRAAGLEHDGLVAALRAEREHSLAAIGLGALPGGLLEATPRDARPGWGTSAKEALIRARRMTGQRTSRDHRRALLAGILQARLGTVPRALGLAGVDIDALLGRIQRS